MSPSTAQDLAERLLSQRAIRGMESLGGQTSIPLEGIINVGSGTPSFPTPEHVIAAAHRALDDGYTAYTPWLGYLDLREAIAEKLLRDNALHYNPQDEIMVTTGAQEALSVICHAFFEPGDEMILPDPYYNEYTRWASNSGAVLVGVPTSQDDDFIVDPEAIAEAITSKTKMIALTTPNNPTGTVLPATVLERIAEIAVERDLIVLSDELYDQYIYPSYCHTSIASLPQMKDRTILVNGFSKTYAMTGFRVGYIAAPAPFVSAMLPIKHSFSICACAVSQRAALAALTGPTSWWEPVYAACKARREQWMEGLDDMGLTYGTPMGSYVFLIDTSSLGISGSEFSQRLLSDEKVRIGAGNGYGTRAANHVRGSLMIGEADLEEALTRTRRVIERIREAT